MGSDERAQHLPIPAFDGGWGSSSLDTRTSPLRPSALPPAPSRAPSLTLLLSTSPPAPLRSSAF